MRRARKAQEESHRARANWQQEAQNFRKNNEQQKLGGSAGGREQESTGSQSRSRYRAPPRSSPPPNNSTRDKHLQTLGLKPGWDYKSDEIKKAYRRKVMKVHPDVGGSHEEFIAVQEANDRLKRAE